MSKRGKGGRFVGVDVEVLRTPRYGEVLTDRWWMVGPEGALFWQRNGSRGWSPQCNSDRRAVDLFIKDHDPSEHLEAVFLPVAYVGPWDEEWGYVTPPFAAGVTQ